MVQNAQSVRIGKLLDIREASFSKESYLWSQSNVSNVMNATISFMFCSEPFMNNMIGSFLCTHLEVDINCWLPTAVY